MKKKSIKISIEDTKFIVGDKSSWEKILVNYPCGTCTDSYGNEFPMIIKYVELNDLNDLILHGKCGRCSGVSNRYLETGQARDSYNRAEIIREQMSKLSNLRNKNIATKKQISEAWERATKPRGKNPDIWRRDCKRRLIRKGSYGTKGEYGWEIDHKKPISKKGSDHGHNLQAMHWEENRKKSDKY